MIKLEKNIYRIKKDTFSFWCILLAICVAFHGCSAGIKQQSVVDTPDDRYKSGMQKLEADDHAGAESDFLRAVALDKRSPSGHTGLAFLDLSRSDYKSALKHAETALKKDDKFVDAYIAKGRIITVRKKNDRWTEKALESFESALELAPENEKVLYYMAEYYYESGVYDRAIEYYSKAKEKNGNLTEKSSVKIIHTGKIIEASLLTNEGRRIAKIEKMSRADFCVLLIEEFKLKQILERRQPELFKLLFNDDYTLKAKTGRIKSEIGNNTAKEWILEIIQIDIPFLDLYPDGFFYPDRLVTKSQFAVVIQEVLALINDDTSFSTRYIGMESRFNDVRSDYYAFNAINLCVDLDIMETTEDGNFISSSIVSGMDAILMLRKVENIP
ncbi:tetratricopeptide repeat protein [Candidatus Latescibacterota bacterium]